MLIDNIRLGQQSRDQLIRLKRITGIDLSAVQGSGPRGRIVKSDVEAAAKGGVKATPQTQAARPAAVGTHGDSGIAPLPDARLFYKAGDYEEVPHDSMRRTIAKRLTSAKALRIWHDQIQYKPAANGGVNMWHQDAPLWPIIAPMTEVTVGTASSSGRTP